MHEPQAIQSEGRTNEIGSQKESRAKELGEGQSRARPEALEGEEWRDCVGWEGLYMVSNLGRVFSIRSGKFMKPYLGHYGYVIASLSIRGHSAPFAVHRLVAKAFIPNLEGKTHVNHIDFNRSNNNVLNLEWTSPGENVRHSSSAGRMNHTLNRKRGIDHPNSKVTEDDVRRIRSMVGKQRDIAKAFGISQRTAASIIHRRLWAHVS